MRKTLFNLLLVALGAAAALPLEAKWQPAGGNITTRWAAQVNPDAPLPEYPRPQMVRQEWVNLNGLWDYAVTGAEAAVSEINDGQILVPFAIESALSGVKRSFKPTEKLWYKRTLEIPSAWKGRRVILHFGAVDYVSTVRLNGHLVGNHEGGNDAFGFDITDFLTPAGPQELILEVTDPSDSGKQPRGKQVLEPKGIWYTPVSGIWKTVWMEPVNPTHITAHHSVPDIDRGKLTVKAFLANATPGAKVRFTALDKGRQIATATASTGQTVELSIPAPKLWSPDSPFLYDLKMEAIGGDGKVTDKVDSYFGMRKISVAKDEKGVNRIMLNNKFVFQYGFLDQGWWPDGLLTAPTEEALVSDIIFTKDAGYNTIRKHIKLESERFYYNCDRLGILVWQDAISGDNYNLKNFMKGIDKDASAAAKWQKEFRAMMDQLRNYPCIVNWVVFNEGWGQFGGRTMIDWAKNYDPSRLVEVSGWVDMGNGDIIDIHHYPAPGRIENAGPERAFVVGEFGGLGLPTEGHLWNPGMRNWGYATYTDKAKFIDSYKHLVYHLRTMIAEGLSAAIYTQTTDVEGEVNGMLTYDRAVEKIPSAELRQINRPLFDKQVSIKILMADAQVKPQKWYYTTQKPAGDWFGETSAPKGWQVGEAPFGIAQPEGVLSYSYFEREDPANRRNTLWNTRDIWIWREFDLQSAVVDPVVRIRYDEQLEVYVNGQRVADSDNRSAHYYHVDLYPVDKNLLKKGRNTVAIHATRRLKPKVSLSQILDAGVIDVVK
ncbi:beta-galactosidase [Bacteroidia bacterium]|nr:beta-galactosidase [Bacteroidia bacterium]